MFVCNLVPPKLTLRIQSGILRKLIILRGILSSLFFCKIVIKHLVKVFTCVDEFPCGFSKVRPDYILFVKVGHCGSAVISQRLLRL